MRCRNGWACVLGYSAAMLFTILTSAPMAVGATTLENLEAAYQGEMNAQARYLAFAAQADREGYGEVGSLFRAVARAEAIHARHHEGAMRDLGATARPRREEPEVKTTRENLKAAIRGERWEHDRMYAGFLKQARNENDGGAISTFVMASSAESQHARLFRNALSHLVRLKGSAARAFYVCPVCGYTAKELKFENCPICGMPRESFEAQT